MMANWTIDGSRGVAWCPFKKNDDFTSWNGVVDDLNEGEEAKDEVEWLKAELAQVRENERFLKSCNNGQAKLITDLRAELAKAKDEADARVAAVCDAVELWYAKHWHSQNYAHTGELREIMTTNRPKPKFVWEEGKDNYGNAWWRCNNIRIVQILRQNAIAWESIGMIGTFTDIDEAKAAVERHLAEN